MNLRHGLYQLFIAFDQFLNVLLGNPFSTQTWADETWSSRCGRLGHRYPYKAWQWVINLIFWPLQGPNHCWNAYQKERARIQLPPEAR
jgi:hypothetical protein